MERERERRDQEREELEMYYERIKKGMKIIKIATTITAKTAKKQ